MSEEIVDKNVGLESKQWQTLIDSIVEFISASRLMLQVLNARIEGGESNEDVNDNLKDDIDKNIKDIDEIHVNKRYNCCLHHKSKSKDEIVDQENSGKTRSKSFWDIAVEECIKHNKVRSKSIPPTVISKSKVCSKDTTFNEGTLNQNKDQIIKKKDYITMYQGSKKNSAKENIL